VTTAWCAWLCIVPAVAVDASKITQKQANNNPIRLAFIRASYSNPRIIASFLYDYWSLNLLGHL